MLRLKLDQRQNVFASVDAAVKQVNGRSAQLEDAIHTNQEGLLLLERSCKMRQRIEDERIASLEALVRQLADEYRALAKRHDEQTETLVQVTEALRRSRTAGAAGDEQARTIRRLSEEMAVLKQEQQRMATSLQQQQQQQQQQMQQIQQQAQPARTGAFASAAEVAALQSRTERHARSLALLDEDMRDIKRRLTSFLQLWNERTERRLSGMVQPGDSDDDGADM
jgi:hypothetical protein